MLCETCRKEIARDQALEVGDKSYCGECFFKVAGAFRQNLTPEQRRHLKDIVRDEMSGVLPKAVLRGVIEDSFDRIVTEKADPEEELNHLVNRIEQIVGLAISREVLAIIQAIGSTLGQQEDELRDKIRKLGKL